MMSFLIPRLHPDIITYINIEFGDDTSDIVDSSVQLYLNDIKKNLEILKTNGNWEKYKDCINPYEYLFTPIPLKKYCISKYKPLSKSYFEMIELINYFDLINNSCVNILHLCDDASTYIDAMEYLHVNDKEYIHTTISDKNINNSKGKVIYEKLIDSECIMSVNSFSNFNDKYEDHFDIINADCDYKLGNELNLNNMIYVQICYALCSQKFGGNFILKVFDISSLFTIHVIGLLSSMYETISITKPLASDTNSSSKYIVCKNFIQKKSNMNHHYLKKKFLEISSQCILRLFDKNDNIINNSFINKVTEINSIIMKNLIESIHSTINIINTDMKISSDNKNTRLSNLTKLNIDKCIQWCINNNVEISIY